MKILITGANGFIGSHLLELLSNKAEYKICITLRSTSDVSKIVSLRSGTNKIDIFYLDQTDINEVISDFLPDLVIHLATYYVKKHSSDDVSSLVNTNIGFPTTILESMIKNNVKYFINTGTFTEYAIDQKFLNSHSRVAPRNLYSATKLAFENLLQFYSNNYNVYSLSLRLFAPYGPRDNGKKLVPYMIRSAINGETAKVSPGYQQWDYIYVKDVARAFELAIKYITKERERFKVFNIGTGESHSPREIAQIIQKLNGSVDVNWGANPYHESEIFEVRADIAETKNVLKWEPSYNFEQGISETFEYYKRVLK